MLTRPQRRGIERLVEENLSDAEISKRLGIDNPQELRIYRKSKRLLTPSEKRTRREIIGGVVGTGVVLATGGLIYDLTRPITFEDALKNPELRQQYIDELVEKHFGREAYKYVSKFNYDPNQTLVNSALSDERDKLRQDKNFFQRIAMNYSHLPEFENVPYAQVEAEARKFFETKEGKESMLQFADYNYKLRSNHVKTNFARTIQYFYDFGKRKKSDLYIFNRSFEETTRNTGGGTLTFKPSEERLLAILYHELNHAKDFFEGIDLGDDIKMGNQAYIQTLGLLSDYLLESRAFVKTLELTRKFEKDSSVHKLTLIDFAKLLSTNEQLLRYVKLLPQEYKIIEKQEQILLRLASEHKEVGDIFQAYGIRLDIKAPKK